MACRANFTAGKIVTAHTDKGSRMSLVAYFTVCLIGKIGAVKLAADVGIAYTVKGVGIFKGKLINVDLHIDSVRITDADASHKRIVES